MNITNQIIEKHGLTLEEFKIIKKILNRELIYWNLEYFLQCGMSIALTNLQNSS